MDWCAQSSHRLLTLNAVIRFMHLGENVKCNAFDRWPNAICLSGTQSCCSSPEFPANFLQPFCVRLPFNLFIDVVENFRIFWIFCSCHMRTARVTWKTENKKGHINFLFLFWLLIWSLVQLQAKCTVVGIGCLMNSIPNTFGFGSIYCCTEYIINLLTYIVLCQFNCSRNMSASH